MRTTHSITSKLALLVAAGALGLAACGDDDDADNASAPGQSSRQAPVSVETIDGSRVLVDSRGRALYSADQETSRRVLCTDGCTTIWDPVTVGGGNPPATGELELGVVERPDGARQVTFRGRPLYRFTEEGPGELTGDGFADDFAGVSFTWSAATVDGDGGGSTGSPGGGLGY